MQITQMAPNKKVKSKKNDIDYNRNLMRAGHGSEVQTQLGQLQLKLRQVLLLR